MSDVAFINGLESVEAQSLYRAMDFLLASHEEVQREVFHSGRNVLNLEVDLIFVDTTSTYFEIEGEDADPDAVPRLVIRCSAVHAQQPELAGDRQFTLASRTVNHVPALV